MAQELDDGEFWLPSEFLTDDDLLKDFKTDKKRDDFSYLFGGFNSDLSSPVESVTGSTTESDEDELISGLTRKLANSTLKDAGFSNGFSGEYTAKGLKLSGSPQSTLCGYKPGSSQNSPNSVSRVSSPPATTQEPTGWDFLYAAAGEVARMKMSDETAPLRSSSVFTPPHKLIAGGVKKPNPVTDFYQNQAQTEAHLAYLQLQASHFQRMKQQQMLMKNGAWGHEKLDYQFQNGKLDYQFLNGKLNGEIGRTQGLSTAAWPTLQQSQKQQQPGSGMGSGMRAVFLGENVAKKERTGTGVFLPRRFGANPNEPPRKKSGGNTTVLIPDKVAHALNLNLDSIDATTQKSNRNFTPEYDAAVKQRTNILMAQQRKTTSYIQNQNQNQELRLPQEWTY